MKTFDPSQGADDEHIAQKNAELYNALLEELKKQTTGRWHYDKIDYCWTGKDADLETCGYQGLHVDDIDDSFVTATVHAGKTVVGDDVCLNLPETATETERHKARDLYLEQAYEVVAGCDCNGEWDGDSWWFSDESTIQVATILNEETGELDAEAMVSALYNEAQKALEVWDREMSLMDKILNHLAGWTDSEGNRVNYFEVWARSDEEALDLAKLVDLNKGTVLETRLTDEDQMDIIQREAQERDAGWL